jgi:uncharacterized Rmd1/YagE family protein
MQTFDFTAFALDGETDLHRVAAQLQITKRCKWEEPLILVPGTLQLYGGGDFADPRVFLYAFGTVVFYCCDDAVIAAFFQALANTAGEFRNPRSSLTREKYSLQLDEGARLAVTNDYTIIPKRDPLFIDIIAYTIAKSVALEQIEARVDVVFDTMEEIIARLDQGKLAVPDRELAKSAATILNFKYRSIAHIMILDKPDITWDSEEADRFYSTLANLFELQQRYSQIKQKSDTLLDITDVFTGLAHARRSARLEWIIIILIAIEILLFLYELGR